MNWDIIKTAVAAFFGACIATLQPVHNAMLLLLIFAACDILFGILAGLIAARERFSFKKFILAAGYLLVYLGIVVMVYAVGKYQDDTQEALYVVKVITYVFIYFYSSNILKNCMEHTPAGGCVRVQASEDAVAFRLSVADTGPGIAAEDLPRLFERFYQGGGARSSAGAGLGLAIVSQLAASMGATAAASLEGDFLRVTVELQ